MHGFLEDFTEPVAELGGSIVDAAVAIYGHISADLLPTPAKSHYVFNLRDLSKCIQGMLQADSKTLRDADHMLR
jgi:dynein heavy chain